MEWGLLAFVPLVYVDGDRSFVCDLEQHIEIDGRLLNTGVVKWSGVVDVIDCD